MTDSHAEQLDPSVLGERVGDYRRPAADYPPEQPLGVEDPSILDDGRIALDDVETRDDRTRPEAGEHPASSPADRIDGGLIEPDRTSDGTDREPQLAADIGDSDTGPEAAALRVEDD